MTLLGDSGKVLYGALKTLSITPYVNEQNLTSTALPTGANASAIPGSPQVSFTINTSTMVPTFSGVNVLSYKPIYGLNVSGQNTSGASQTIYFNIYKNGSSYKTGNLSVSNNNYFTITMADSSFVNGDKLDFYIWTPASSGVNYFYQNINVMPSRIDTGSKNVANITYKLVTYASSTYFPLTGKANAQSTGSVYAYPATDTNQSNYIGLNNTATNIISLLSVNSAQKLYGCQFELYSQCQITQSASYYPNMYINELVSSISYRDLNIR